MKSFSDYYFQYIHTLSRALESVDQDQLDRFADTYFEVWSRRGTIFFIGNGGSAGNSIHIANDFVYGAANPSFGGGAKAVSLAANSSILTCLGNDLGYADIFSSQLSVYGEKGDLLIALSGSGNSDNVLKAIAVAKQLGMITSGILGFDGGEALGKVDVPLHLKVSDMQLSEDFQLILMHALMQYAHEKK